MKSQVFRYTLTIILILLFGGISAVLMLSFNNTVNRIKESAALEHYQIVETAYSDFCALKSREGNIAGSLSDLLRVYEDMAVGTDRSIMFFHDHRPIKVIGETQLEKMVHEQTTGENRVVSMTKKNDEHYVVVVGNLPTPFEEYTVQYASVVTDLISPWKHTRNLLLAFGIGLSGFVVLILIILLRRVFLPIEQVSAISKKIADGNYSMRIPITGKDELEQMEQSFNHMASKIESQVASLVLLSKNQQEFIDSFAHEIRTPLTAMIGYAEYLQKAALDEQEQYEALETIISEGNRMQEMASQLLMLADLRKKEIEKTQINLSELFWELEKVANLKVQCSHISLRFIVNAPYLLGDYSLVFQLLSNLIENAVKACGGSGAITVASDGSGEDIILSVNDTGKGIPKELLKNITEPYYRVDPSRSRKDGGAGIGLSICQKIAESHGAKLIFDSEPGKGTQVKAIFTT